MPDSGGVTSADGTISVGLDDGTTIFMTGDCWVGDVVNGGRSAGEKMINSALVRIGNDYTYRGSIYGGTQAEPFSLMIPPEAAASTRPYWYWAGHAFQRGNTLWCFMTKFYQGGEGQWGFRFDGTDIVELDMTDWSTRSITNIYDGSCPVHWGHCIMQQGEWYYIYGSRGGAEYDPKQLCVSRAQWDDAAGKLGVFEYFDGTGWSADSNATAGLAGIDIPVSEQFSVFENDGKVVLITQSHGREIFSFIADSPVGPWRNKKLLWMTTEPDTDPDLFTYNAMAHPSFINDKNELLICYNINSYDLSKPFADVNTYRPVFLRVPMEMILR